MTTPEQLKQQAEAYADKPSLFEDNPKLQLVYAYLAGAKASIQPAPSVDLVKEAEEYAELPGWGEIGGAYPDLNPIETFVYAHEPAGTEDEIDWREGLSLAIKTAYLSAATHRQQRIEELQAQLTASLAFIEWCTGPVDPGQRVKRAKDLLTSIYLPNLDKSTKAWSGVDKDKFMDEVRGEAPTNDHEGQKGAGC